MSNTKAARVLTAGKGQCLALIKEHPDKQLKMDRTRAEKANIRFENGSPFKLLGTVTVNTFFGQVNFYVIKTDTLFLLLFKNINRINVYLNNVIN